MQKSIAKLVLGSLLFGGIAIADMPVPATALPQNAQNFVSSNFSGAQIMYVEQDFDSFEARLSNGVKIDFYLSGDWKEIESYNGINPSLLPAQVAKTLQTSFPNVNVIKIDKEWGGYEVKLANMLKVYINESGAIIGQKYDD